MPSRWKVEKRAGHWVVRNNTNAFRRWFTTQAEAFRYAEMMATDPPELRLAPGSEAVRDA